MTAGLLAALLLGALSASAAARKSFGGDGLAVSAPPPLLGMVGPTLAVLDPTTLRPLASPRPLVLGRPPSLLRPVLSPDGTRVAVPSASLYVVDRARLRVVRRIADEAYRGLKTEADDLVWMRGGRTFAFTGVGKFGLALYFVGGTNADTDIEGEVIRTPDGPAVLATICCGRDGVVLLTYAPDEREIVLPFTGSAAVDARRKRMFVVSSAGKLAVVDLRKLTFKTHAVTLPSGLAPSDVRGVAWLGRGHLAFWGSRGLWLINTRDWSGRLIDQGVRDAAVGANALLTWDADAASGITVYSAAGTLRFRALDGRKIARVRATARYAYVDASGGRFSIDLRTASARGPLTSRATPVVPDFLSLP